MELREKMKAVRLALGETQIEFAARMGVPQALYSRWETGLRKPSYAARALINRIFADIERQLMEGQDVRRTKS